MTQVLECEGAPRDLGVDQGRWCRSAVLAAYRDLPVWERAALRLGRGSDSARRLHRDLRRFFPQQSEVIDGLARSTGVAPRWLAGRSRGEDVGGASPADRVAFGSSREVGGAWLARSVPSQPVLRRSQPEGGFRSIEITQPWRPSPLVGVNEAGLAVSVMTRFSSDDRGCAAPAAWLVFDCLARFDRVAGAVDWCVARPGGGSATLLLADATGELARVECEDHDRQVVRPADGLLVVSDRGARHDAVGKSLREGVVDPVDRAHVAGCDLLTLETQRARLGWLSEAGPPRWFGVEPDASP